MSVCTIRYLVEMIKSLKNFEKTELFIVGYEFYPHGTEDMLLAFNT